MYRRNLAGRASSQLRATASGITQSWWPMAAARTCEAPQSVPSPGQQSPGLVKHKEHTSFSNVNCLKVKHFFSLKDEAQKNLSAPVYPPPACNSVSLRLEEEKKAAVMGKDITSKENKTKQRYRNYL